MASQTIPGGLCWPQGPIHDDLSTVTTLTAGILNGVNDVVMVVFRMPKTASIAKIGFNISTNSSFNGTVMARVETVNAANGSPTGTLVATDAEVEVTDETTGWKKVTLTTAPEVTAGTYVAVGLRCTALTAGSIQVTAYHSSNFRAGEIRLPYTLINTSQKVNAIGAIHIEYDDGDLAQGVCLPAIGLALDSWGSSSTPDRRGLRFKFPFPVELSGFWAHCHNYTTDLDWELYDSDGTTVLETQTLDDDITYSGGLGYRHVPITPRTLTKDVYYRLILLPSDGVARQNLKLVEVGETASLDMWGGRDMHYTTTDGAPSVEGDWTNTTTKTLSGFGLLLTAFDDGAGGGGSETFTGNVINRGIN